MKKVWTKYASNKNAWTNFLYEIAFIFGVLAVGLVLALIWSDKGLTFEFFCLLACFLCLAVLTAVYYVHKKLARKKQGTPTENADSIIAIEAALQPLADDIVCRGGAVKLQYKSSLLEISWHLDHTFQCCVSLQDGTKKQKLIEARDVYMLAVEFLCDKCNLSNEICIPDEQINFVNEDGIVYTDEFGREHKIDWAECGKLVVKANLTRQRLELYTVKHKTVIVFEERIRRKTKEHLLSGGREQRFKRLQSLIEEKGFVIEKE